MTTRVARHTYKEVRLQQLRSFCETARLESLAGAAKSLGLAGPTVWEQVHALERAFAAKLVEPHGRGCRLTAEGRLLASLAAPLVGGIDTLQRNFEEARGQVETWLTVAATQRMLVEDLPEPVVEFERRFPLVRLRLRELGNEQVTVAVESGEADLGLAPAFYTDPSNPWLDGEPAYALDFHLVTPSDHPLTLRRRIRPRDLLPYPLVNAPGSVPNPATNALLDGQGAFAAQPRRVEAIYTAVIRRYVELGFGIGIVAGLPGRMPSSSLLHERPLGREFGQLPIHSVWRKGASPQGPARAFLDTVKTLLNRQRSGAKSRRPVDRSR